MFSQGMEGIAKLQAEIDSLVECFITLREACEGGQRLFEARDCFAVGGTAGGLRAGLMEVGDSLVPHLPLQGMMSKQLWFALRDLRKLFL